MTVRNPGSISSGMSFSTMTDFLQCYQLKILNDKVTTYCFARSPSIIEETSMTEKSGDRRRGFAFFDTIMTSVLVTLPGIRLSYDTSCKCAGLGTSGYSGNKIA